MGKIQEDQWLIVQRKTDTEASARMDKKTKAYETKPHFYLISYEEHLFNKIILMQNVLDKFSYVNVKISL